MTNDFFLDIIKSLWHVISIFLNALAPLFIGLILAYLFNPAVEWVRQKISGMPKLPFPQESPSGRGIAIFITYSSVFIILMMIIYAFIVLIIGALPSGGPAATFESVYNYFESSLERISAFMSQHIDPNDAKQAVLHKLKEHFSFSGIMDFAASAASNTVSLFIGLVASIYLLKDKEFFLSLWQKFLSLILKQKTHGITNEILSEINIVITTFIKGALIDSLIVALLSSIALSVVGVDYAVIIGIIGGILNIIPYFGPIFGMIPAFIVAFTTDGIGQAVLTIAALFLIQQLDSNFIYPKVVGSSTGLHPLFVLISVSFFGYFGGIGGMLIAVPVAGIFQVVIKKLTYR